MRLAFGVPLILVAGCVSVVPGLPGSFIGAETGRGGNVNVEGRIAPARLYIGSAWISEYKLSASKPIRSVAAYRQAIALATDNSGHLFAANGLPTYGAIDVYDRYDLRLIRQIQTIAPTWLAVDRAGYLYVSNSGDGINVYRPGGGRLIGVIRRGVHRAKAMAFSSSGDLYVANAHSIGIYAPGKSAGRMTYVGHIIAGATNPNAVALNASGDLAVANCVTCVYNKTNKHDYVSVYAARASTPAFRVTEGIKTPIQVELADDRTLYVADEPFTHKGFTRGWLSVYAPGTSVPLRIVRNSINYPIAMKLRPDGYLYVANLRGGAVTVYSDRGAKLVQTIVHGAHYPAALEFGFSN